MHIDKDLAFRLAQIGSSPSTIAAALGITVKELSTLSEYNPEVAAAIESGRAKGCSEALQALHNMALSGKSVEAIKFYLAVQSPDYRVDKAAVEITNNTLALPTPAEAMRILRDDPACKQLSEVDS